MDKLNSRKKVVRRQDGGILPENYSFKVTKNHFFKKISFPIVITLGTFRNRLAVSGIRFLDWIGMEWMQDVVG